MPGSLYIINVIKEGRSDAKRGRSKTTNGTDHSRDPPVHDEIATALKSVLELRRFTYELELNSQRTLQNVAFCFRVPFWKCLGCHGAIGS